MRIFGFGFLIVCLLLASPASMVIAVADVAQVAAPDATQTPPQPTPEEDLLNLSD
jgi:hypothetical protein